MCRPNIVFILMDDLGWKDIGCYGSSFYETPNIDRLAREGMRFTDAYAACPVCSPTRASILTGKYPARVGVTDWIDWGGGLHPAKGKVVDVPYIDHLPLNEHNLARTLSEAGYHTWHVGKWHLGGSDYYPDKQGFDKNIGGCALGLPWNSYFSPWNLPTLKNGEDGEYLPDRLTDEAIGLIENSDVQPFFLNLWYYLVHTPIQTPERYIDKYKEKASALGLDEVETLREGEYFSCEHKKDKRICRRLVQSDPTYAGMVQNMDENIGRVLQTLEETGQAENTVVIFTSDNGGLATAEGSPTCNFPLLEGKGWMYEGGTREPLIVRWPGQVPPDSTCTVPVTSPDFYPTLLDIAGLDRKPEQHCDGESLLPLLKEEGELERDAIFWHYPHYGNQGGTPGASVRMGDYKLIEFFEDNHVELYNLRQDVSEQHDLSTEEPEKTAELRQRLHEWQRSVEARIPERNPAYQS